MSNHIDHIQIKHIKGAKSYKIQEFSCDKYTKLTIGRSSAADIAFDPLKDDMVSREHAVIDINIEAKVKFFLEDLASANGTFLNGQKISGPKTLSIGDKIQLGKGGPEFEFQLITKSSESFVKNSIKDDSLAGTDNIVDEPTTIVRPSESFHQCIK